MYWETNGLNGGRGVKERGPTNNIPLPKEAGNVPLWRSKSLKRWVRIRLLSDAGYPAWDLSYCYAELINGAVVRCNSGDLPAMDYSQFPKPLSKWKANALAEAKEFGVYLKGTGIFEALSTLG